MGGLGWSEGMRTTWEVQVEKEKERYMDQFEGEGGGWRNNTMS